jgi:hypothetical protein
MGNPKYLVNKTAGIRLALSSGKSINVKGVILRFEPVEGRKDLAALAIKYDAEKVSFEYKMMINDYLKHNARAPKPRAVENDG